MHSNFNKARYVSTRGSAQPVLSATAIMSGIAPDGGLFVPEESVSFPLPAIAALASLNYQQRANHILKMFLADYSPEDLADCINHAYRTEKFSSPQIAPVVKLEENLHILELWHGPTCAFKDMALQILPHLLVKAIQKSGETRETVILVATSGDTGKAALEGFKDVPGTQVIVFFPDKGVSAMQKLQMVTQKGNNVYAIGIDDGNFDDAQNGVKAIFTDAEYNEVLNQNGYQFSSANSINWGRLVPQIVYYFSAYADLIKNGSIRAGEKINVAVPTGNFGNILAAWYARSMGLPVNRLICASNSNNVLTDFIRSGTYNRYRPFRKTISPSMDILISSNLERLLFELTGHDPQPINQWMKELKNVGEYTVDDITRQKISRLFWADFCNEEETLATIRKTWNLHSYVVDTHTAVALNVYEKYLLSTGDTTKTLIASTASPFKFNTSVVKAIFGEGAIREKSEFELLDTLSHKCNLSIPDGLNHLQDKKILHKNGCTAAEMKDQVSKILGIQIKEVIR